MGWIRGFKSRVQDLVQDFKLASLQHSAAAGLHVSCLTVSYSVSCLTSKTQSNLSDMANCSRQFSHSCNKSATVNNLAYYTPSGPAKQQLHTACRPHRMTIVAVRLDNGQPSPQHRRMQVTESGASSSQDTKGRAAEKIASFSEEVYADYRWVLQG